MHDSIATPTFHDGVSHLGGRAEPPALAREKIKTLEELAEVAARLRANGETIGLAHGVFDLLHMGHVRHLEEVRRHTSRLIVSVTPDRFVNKGPGRPVFNEVMRAEMLAALGCVDWVAINVAPTAEPAIEAIKPHVYAKGTDYADASQDVTGKITAERNVVERYGGRILFTDGVTFSSSELINRYFNPFNPAVRAFLDTMRKNDERDSVINLIEQASKLRVLIVGDAIIDEYRYVLPMSKTPKENLIATLYQSRELFAGGAIATANHVAGICDSVDVVTMLGAEDDYEQQLRSSIKPNVNLHLMRRDKGPSTLKVRFVDPGQMRKLFEVYHMDDTPIPESLQGEFNSTIRRLAPDYDLVIVNDFGHGLIHGSSIETLTNSSRFMALNTQTNSANFGYNLVSKYKSADYICIDGPEARLSVGDKYRSIEHVITEAVPQIISCPKIIVTQGQYGCIAYSREEPTCQVPAFADKAVDTVGAGDAFLAMTAPLVADGGTMRHVAFIGNVAGALKVNIVGHRESIEKASLIKAVTALLK